MFPVRLETKRLLIREFEASDLDAVETYASDPDVVRYEIWGPNSRQQSEQFLSTVVIPAQRVQPRSAYELAIEVKGGGLVGGCGMRIKDPGTRTADLGYVLAKAHWGKGYIPEAIDALLGFGFGALGLHRVWATTDVRNVQSVRVLEKVGMRREGVHRAERRLRGVWIDCAYYAMLETEWAERARGSAFTSSGYPGVLKNPLNRIATSSQFTNDVEGYVFDGADGSQVAFWTANADRTSTEHTHDFDEYVIVVEGQATVIIGNETTVLAPGDEMVIPKGTKQRMAVTAHTRTIHVFGGKRARRESESS